MALHFRYETVAGMPIPGLAPGTSMVIQAIPQAFNVRLRLQQRTYREVNSPHYLRCRAPALYTGLSRR